MNETLLPHPPTPSDITAWPLSALFHENTKLNSSNALGYARHIERFAGNLESVEKAAHHFKAYPSRPRITLPRRGYGRCAPLKAVIRRRRTARLFTGRDLSLHHLSEILLHAYGQTGEVPVPQLDAVRQPLRAAPSAGALYPLELYAAVFQSSGFPSGIFHYHVPDHTLEVLSEKPRKTEFEKVIMAPGMMPTTSAALVITGMFERVLPKYQDRGYRFLLLDAGHLAQNVLLTAESRNLAAVPIGGFQDDALSCILGLNPAHEAALYVILLGSRISTSRPWAYRSPRS